MDENPSNELEVNDGNEVPKKERPPTGLNANELALLQASSKLSEEEVKDLYEEFIERFPSGELDLENFIKFQQKLDLNVDEEACKIEFQSADKSNDGKITFDEFLFRVAAEKHADNLEQRLAVIFDLWDVSGNGQLNRKELARVISAIFNLYGVEDRFGENSPSKLAKSIIEKLDVDDDNTLDREEFIEGLKNNDEIRELLLRGH